MNPIIEIHHLKKRFVSLIRSCNSNKERVKIRRTIGLLNEAIQLFSVKEVYRAKMDSVQDEFICPISQETMTDPVMTPSGQSYEKSAIEKWLNKNNTDPLTRERLTIEQLYPNRALKKLIDKII